MACPTCNAQNSFFEVGFLEGFQLGVEQYHYRIANIPVGVSTEPREHSIYFVGCILLAVGVGVAGDHPWPRGLAILMILAVLTISIITCIPLTPELIDPRQLRFCQDEICDLFNDDSPVTRPHQGDRPQIAVVITQGERYAINNRTLFNALYNGIEKVRILVVEKPANWEARFTNANGGYCVTVQGLVLKLAVDRGAVCIPSSAINSEGNRGICITVLQVRNFVKPQRSETLFSILKDFCEDIDIQEVQGERSYARIEVDFEDVELITNIIKAIGKQRGKQVEVCEILSQRRYNSPRD